MDGPDAVMPTRQTANIIFLDAVMPTCQISNATLLTMSCPPVRLMMDASPAPITIRLASKVQKLLAKPQPTEDTMKMAIPQPVPQ